MNNPTPAVCIPWYQREHYPRILELFEDRLQLPSTFEQWEQAAQVAYQRIERQGAVPIKVHIHPDTFRAWCEQEGMRLDANAWLKYAAFVFNTRNPQRH